MLVNLDIEPTFSMSFSLWKI